MKYGHSWWKAVCPSSITKNLDKWIHVERDGVLTCPDFFKSVHVRRVEIEGCFIPFHDYNECQVFLHAQK